jgi:hypothetical protein
MVIIHAGGCCINLRPQSRTRGHIGAPLSLRYPFPSRCLCVCVPPGCPTEKKGAKSIGKHLDTPIPLAARSVEPTRFSFSRAKVCCPFVACIISMATMEEQQLRRRSPHPLCCASLHPPLRLLGLEPGLIRRRSMARRTILVLLPTPLHRQVAVERAIAAAIY